MSSLQSWCFCWQALGCVEHLHGYGHRSDRPLSANPQNQRESTLAGFRGGKFNVLVATDVAARGLDISGVELVLQVEPPKDPETYIHRSGGRRCVCATDKTLRPCSACLGSPGLVQEALQCLLFCCLPQLTAKASVWPVDAEHAETLQWQAPNCPCHHYVLLRA